MLHILLFLPFLMDGLLADVATWRQSRHPVLEKAAIGRRDGPRSGSADSLEAEKDRAHRPSAPNRIRSAGLGLGGGADMTGSTVDRADSALRTCTTQL